MILRQVIVCSIFLRTCLRTCVQTRPSTGPQVVRQRRLGGPSRQAHSTALDASKHEARGHGMLPSVETRAQCRGGGGATRPAVRPGAGVFPNKNPARVCPAASSTNIR